MEGVASATPSPLANPVDAIVEELFEKDEIYITLRRMHYRLSLYYVNQAPTYVHAWYRRSMLDHWNSREWHSVNGRDIDSVHDLIAAIISEDSLSDHTTHYSKKLWEMECGSAMSSKRRVRSPLREHL